MLPSKDRSHHAYSSALHNVDGIACAIGASGLADRAGGISLNSAVRDGGGRLNMQTPARANLDFSTPAPAASGAGIRVKVSVPQHICTFITESISSNSFVSSQEFCIQLRCCRKKLFGLRASNAQKGFFAMFHLNIGTKACF